MDIQMFGRLSDAFGPSGFEEDVIRIIAEYMSSFRLENDAMLNLYAHMPSESPDRPVIQLDSHTDECGLMVQTIHDNGSLGIITLGGIALNNLPAHSVLIRTRSGRLVRGIVTSKPVHFMNARERASQELAIETMSIDVGSVSREETTESYGIAIGDPIVPDVSFSFDEEHGVCFGKAFDNRAGCACIIDTMHKLSGEEDKLGVNVVGAFATEEEVGMRGATVTASVVRPDLAIVFEGSPSDDFHVISSEAQCRMKGGVQIRLLDNSYISNIAFVRYAEEIARRCGIPYQEAVRRGGSTDAGRISLSGHAVPVLVLGVPSRYIHSHYNFCAKADLEAASALASEVIRSLTKESIDHILRQDVI